MNLSAINKISISTVWQTFNRFGDIIPGFNFALPKIQYNFKTTLL